MEKQILPVKRNMERFMATTGKSEREYESWAKEVGRRMHINTLDKIVCATAEIYTAAHLVYRLTEMPDGIGEGEADAYLIENSNNAYELAKLWLKTKADADAWICKESWIANTLSCFPKVDFESWGDRNCLADVGRGWFRADGLHLDTQAQEMTEMSGFEIEIQDLVDFVMKFKPGTYRNPAQIKLKQIEARFKSVTTFGIKDYYVQHLILVCQYEGMSDDSLPF